jgi:hypothetical protein
MRERQSWLLALAVVVALAAAVPVLPEADARARKASRAHRLDVREHAGVRTKIARQRNETWRWQHLMGKPLHPYAHSVARSLSLGYDRWVLSLWTRRARAARRQAAHPPHREAWICIHRGEAPWTDPNTPYYGGLQMDYEFQRTYGPDLLRRKGTADRWTPLEQMWVAERAYRSGRGFYPWPNTARYCGLI